MEPDIIRMYSSSPPPLDDAAEEEDEEFGDFGGFSGVASSVSFSEFDSPKGFGQSRVTDSSPPGRFSAVATSFSPDFAQGGPGQLLSDCEPRDPGRSHTAPLSERILGGEAVRKPAPGAQVAEGGRTENRARDRKGDIPAAEVLTNGFPPFDTEEMPVVRPKKRGPAAKPALDCCVHRPVTSSTQMDTPRPCSQVSGAREYTRGPSEGNFLAGPMRAVQSRTGLEKNGVEDDERREGSASLTVTLEGLSNGAWGSYTGQWDPELRTERPSTRRDRGPAVGNSAEQEGAEERPGSPCCRREGAAEEGGMEDECAFGPGTLSVSVSDDFASFCQAVSPDGLEDFGDFRATGFAAAPFSEGEQPPGDRADEEGSFGDFGQAGPEARDPAADYAARLTAECAREGVPDGAEDGESGNEDGQGDFVGFPGSDSFADFTSAPTGAEPEDSPGWNAFGLPEEACPGGGSSWATFQEEQGAVLADESERTCWDAAVAVPPSGSPRTCRWDSSSASLTSRLERLFRASFPDILEPEAGEPVPSLESLLEPPDGQSSAGEERTATPLNREPWGVWWRLQDIHDAFGLRYQWGGSHSNKAMLCSLGIDSHSIRFTGQKKRPVMVPMHAAGLGTLEPTKEPVTPLSAAEKIASIAQAPSSSPEASTSPESSQEALLPIQFDWSSSGLTNPLDAKLETSRTRGLPDADARLVSAVEKTSSSSRNPGWEKPISEEAARVMKALPNLSFMQARVLMFPVSLA